MIKKFINFINEADEFDMDDEVSDIKSEIDKMIEDSLETSDIKTVDDFKLAYKRNQEDNQIEGLVNDADVYEFYLKWRNDIDEILSKVNFYDEIPSEMSSFSLYDYVIKGTKRAILEVIEGD